MNFIAKFITSRACRACNGRARTPPDSWRGRRSQRCLGRQRRWGRLSSPTPTGIEGSLGGRRLARRCRRRLSGLGVPVTAEAPGTRGAMPRGRLPRPALTIAGGGGEEGGRYGRAKVRWSSANPSALQQGGGWRQGQEWGEGQGRGQSQGARRRGTGRWRRGARRVARCRVGAWREEEEGSWAQVRNPLQLSILTWNIVENIFSSHALKTQWNSIWEHFIPNFIENTGNNFFSK